MKDSPKQNPQSSSSETALPAMLHIFVICCVWGGLSLTMLAVAAFGFSKIVDPGLPSSEFLALNPQITPNSADFKEENSTITLYQRESWKLPSLELKLPFGTAPKQPQQTQVSPQPAQPKPVASEQVKTAEITKNGEETQKIPLWVIIAVISGSASASTLITYCLRSYLLNPPKKSSTTSRSTQTKKSSLTKFQLSAFKLDFSTPKAKSKSTTKKTKPKAKQKPQSKRQPATPQPQPIPSPTPQLRVVSSNPPPLRPVKLPPVLNKSAVSSAVTKEEAFAQDHHQTNLVRREDKSISFVTRKM